MFHEWVQLKFSLDLDRCLWILFWLTFTPPEYAPSGQFWGIYALIGGVRVKRL